MLGGGYLKTRDSLVELIHYTRALAKRSKTALEEGEAELEDQLRRPLRIVVCGEDGAGKTAFLEKLLDMSLSEMNEAAPSVSILRSSGYRIFLKEEEACVKHYSHALKDLELVEVNGLSRLSAEQSAAVDYQLSGADFVFIVLPAENPWASKTWDLLSEKQQFLQRKSALILQQVDRREVSDIPMLMGHVKDLSLQRMGEVLPMFAVSAAHGTGVQDCYTMLEKALERSLERRQLLRKIYQQTYGMLRRTEEKIDDRSRNLSGDQEYLQSIEAQIDRLREQEVQSLHGGQLSKLGKLLQGQIKRVMRFTSLRVGVIASHLSLFGKGDTASKVEHFLIDQVSEDAEAFALEEAKRMRKQCLEKWQSMRPHLEERLSVDVGDFDEKSFDGQQEIFCEGMVKSTRYALLHLKLRRFLDGLILSRYRLMRSLLKWMLTLAIAAGVTGFLSEDPLGALPVGLMVLSVGMLIASVIYGIRTGTALKESFEESLEDAVPALRKSLQEGHLDRVRAFYNGFTPMFESMRRHISNAKADLQPQQKIANQLFLRLRSLEQEL